MAAGYALKDGVYSNRPIVPLFENSGFEIVSNIVGSDSRPGREDEKWVNVIGVVKAKK